jgi:hypothetical protein
MALLSLPDGGLLIVTDDPLIKRIQGDGQDVWVKRSRAGDLGLHNLAVSHDGTIVDFGPDDNAKTRWRFNLSGPKPKLIRSPKDQLTAAPKQDGRRVERRKGEFLVDDNAISLDQQE